MTLPSRLRGSRERNLKITHIKLTVIGNFKFKFSPYTEEVGITSILQKKKHAEVHIDSNNYKQ